MLSQRAVEVASAWLTIIDHVEANRDKTLANNISEFNARKIMGSDE